MLKDYQKQVKEYDKKFGWDKDMESHVVLHLMEELGEISRDVMRYEGYKTEDFNKDALAQEFTDLLYLTFKLANKFDIDLDQEWSSMWTRYKDKTSRL